MTPTSRPASKTCRFARAASWRSARCARSAGDADPDNEPVCVVCCPSSARVYGDLDALNSEISKIGQQIFGLGITGMSNGTSWGLYICRFLLFVGLSAGGLIVASAGSVFHIEGYEKIALPALATSLSCILVAGALVLADLGGHARSR